MLDAAAVTATVQAATQRVDEWARSGPASVLRRSVCVRLPHACFSHLFSNDLSDAVHERGARVRVLREEPRALRRQVGQLRTHRAEAHSNIGSVACQHSARIRPRACSAVQQRRALRVASPCRPSRAIAEHCSLIGVGASAASPSPPALRCWLIDAAAALLVSSRLVSSRLTFCSMLMAGPCLQPGAVPVKLRVPPGWYLPFALRLPPDEPLTHARTHRGTDGRADRQTHGR